MTSKTNKECTLASELHVWGMGFILNVRNKLAIEKIEEDHISLLQKEFLGTAKNSFLGADANTWL